MTSFRIIENVYRKHVTVLIEPDTARAERYMRKHFALPDDKSLETNLAVTLYPKRPKLDLVVWIRSRQDVTSLVHEMAHCAFWILDSRGVPTNWSNDESFTYLLEYLMASALQKMGMKRLVGSLGRAA